MIKLIITLFISVSAQAIIPGKLNVELDKQILKIKFTKLGFSKSGICTATAINTNKVLTAAHCVKNFLEDRSFLLRLKVNNSSYKIKNIFIPKGYLELQKKYDDAISNNLSFNKELKEVSLVDIAVIEVKGNLLKKFVKSEISFKAESKQYVRICGYGFIEFKENLYSGNSKQLLHCASNSLIIDGQYLSISGNLKLKNYVSALTAPGDSGSPLFDKDLKQIGVLSGIIKKETGDGSSFYSSAIMLSNNFLAPHL